MQFICFQIHLLTRGESLTEIDALMVSLICNQRYNDRCNAQVEFRLITVIILTAASSFHQIQWLTFHVFQAAAHGLQPEAVLPWN